MTWEIVVGIITLISACIAICSIVSNNTKALTEVKCSVDELSRSLKRQDSVMGKLAEQVDNHEIRLTKLEK